MDADRCKFPAGVFRLPMSGWLFQTCEYPHEVHNCLTDKKVPISFVLIVQGDKHFLHALNSSISAEKNTMNLASFIVPIVRVYLHLKLTM